MADDLKAEFNLRVREQFISEVLALASRDDYQLMPKIVIVGLLDVATVMMKNLVELEPPMLPAVLQQIDHVRASILPAGREPISN